MTIFYKIKDIETQKFSPGTTYAVKYEGEDVVTNDLRWSKNGGKIWKTAGHLKAHLKLILTHYGSIPKSWRIVHLEVNDLCVRQKPEDFLKG